MFLLFYKNKAFAVNLQESFMHIFYGNITHFNNLILLSSAGLNTSQLDWFWLIVTVLPLKQFFCIRSDNPMNLLHLLGIHYLARRAAVLRQLGSSEENNLPVKI